MTRQLLLEIFNKRLFLDLILLMLSFGITWSVILKSGFRILKVDVRLKKIIPGAVLLTFISIFLKPVLPGIIFFFITMLPLMFLLKFYGKTKWIIAGWVNFLLLLFSNIGPMLIIIPLSNSNRALASFFLTSRYGVMIGGLCESLFPALLLLFFSIFNVSLIPSPGKILSTVDFIDIYIFGALLFWCYDSVMRILEVVQDGSKQAFLKLGMEWAIAAGAVLAFYIKKVNSQKKLEYAINKIQELDNSNNEKSAKLEQLKEIIATLAPSAQNVDNQPSESTSTEVSLTTNEMKVLQIIANEGKSNKEIADILQLSEGYVKNIVRKILKKTNLADRTQLAIYALKNDLIDKNNQ